MKIEYEYTFGWSDFDDMCRNLADQIKASKYDVTNIYPYDRDGAVVATRLSYLLKKPVIRTPDLRNTTLVVHLETGISIFPHSLTASLLWIDLGDDLFKPTFHAYRKTYKQDYKYYFPWQKEY